MPVTGLGRRMPLMGQFCDSPVHVPGVLLPRCASEWRLPAGERPPAPASADALTVPGAPVPAVGTRAGQRSDQSVGVSGVCPRNGRIHEVSYSAVKETRKLHIDIDHLARFSAGARSWTLTHVPAALPRAAARDREQL